MCDGYLLIDIYTNGELSPDTIGIKRYDSYDDAIIAAKRLIGASIRGEDISEEDEILINLTIDRLKNTGHAQIGDIYLEIRDMM